MILSVGERRLGSVVGMVVVVWYGDGDGEVVWWVWTGGKRMICG